MENTTQIIVYRNPVEAIFWQSLMGSNMLGLILILCIFFIISTVIVFSIYQSIPMKKRNKKNSTMIPWGIVFAINIGIWAAIARFT